MMRCLFVLCVLLSRFAGAAQYVDFLTLRYYGRHERFSLTRDWPSDPSEVCATFPAVCVDLYLDRCVRTPPEMRVPWLYRRLDGDTHEWSDGQTRDGDEGGNILLTSEVQGFSDGGRKVLVLYSGCADDCSDCRRGKGRWIYLPFEDIPYCRVTEEVGVAGLLYNRGDGSMMTDFNCVPSLISHWNNVEASMMRVNVIRGVVGGVVSLCLVFIVGIFLVRKRKLAMRRREQMADGRLEFVVSDNIRRQVGLEQMNELFPAKPLHGEAQCAVCLENVVAGELVRTLQCNHAFHPDCITSWWLHRRSGELQCPVCRAVQALADERTGVGGASAVVVRATPMAAADEAAGPAGVQQTLPQPETIGAVVVSGIGTRTVQPQVATGPTAPVADL